MTTRPFRARVRTLFRPRVRQVTPVACTAGEILENTIATVDLNYPNRVHGRQIHFADPAVARDLEARQRAAAWSIFFDERFAIQRSISMIELGSNPYQVPASRRGS